MVRAIVGVRRAPAKGALLYDSRVPQKLFAFCHRVRISTVLVLSNNMTPARLRSTKYWQFLRNTGTGFCIMLPYGYSIVLVYSVWHINAYIHIYLCLIGEAEILLL